MCAWGSLPYAGWGEIIGILCRDVRLSFSHRYDAAGVRRLVEGDLTLDFRHGYVGGTLLIYFEVYIYKNILCLSLFPTSTPQTGWLPADYSGLRLTHRVLYLTLARLSHPCVD